jgi:DNA polymerase-3 subunit delta
MQPAFIKTAKLHSFYVLAGDDDFFRGEFIKELLEVFLAGKLDDTSMESYDLTEKENPAEVSSIIESAKTPPFFSEKKFILVREFTKLKKDDLEKLTAFLPHIPDFTVMVLTTGQEAKKVLDMDIPSANIINLSSSGSADIKTWIVNYLKELGKTINPDVLDYIISEANGDAAAVKNEMDKILLFVGNRTAIEMADFSETKGVSREYNLDELTEAIAEKDEKRAMFVFEKIYAETSPEQMLGFIFYKIKGLYIMRYFLSTGEFKKIFKFAYMKDMDKAKIQAKNFAKVPYADIVEIIKEADSKIKLSNRDKAKTILTIMLERIFLRLQA